MRFQLSAAALLFSLAPLHADAVMSGIRNVHTLLHANGDRQFQSAEFLGSPTVFGALQIGQFQDGRLSYGASSFGWTDPIPRDVTTRGNRYPANPDRADVSSAYMGEGLFRGTLQEIFGGNNLSRLIDGEDNGVWTLDLFFAPGRKLFSDGNPRTVEVAILERGRNSDIGVQGIYDDGGRPGYTAGLVVPRTQFAAAGWSLNTLEIGSAQPVGGVGLDLDSLGSVSAGLTGIRLYSRDCFNGPDLINVLTSGTVPEPGTLLLLVLGAWSFVRWPAKS